MTEPPAFRQTESGIEPIPERFGPQVIRAAELVGELVLDPGFTPPWPGAGVVAVQAGFEPPAERVEVTYSKLDGNLMTVHAGCGGPVIWCVDDTGLCTRCHASGIPLAEAEQVTPPWQ